MNQSFMDYIQGRESLCNSLSSFHHSPAKKSLSEPIRCIYRRHSQNGKMTIRPKLLMIDIHVDTCSVWDGNINCFAFFALVRNMKYNFHKYQLLKWTHFFCHIKCLHELHLWSFSLTQLFFPVLIKFCYTMQECPKVFKNIDSSQHFYWKNLIDFL